METPETTTSKLTLEQQLGLRHFKDELAKASETQKSEIAVMVYQQLMYQKNMYNSMLKSSWGLDNGDV